MMDIKNLFITLLVLTTVFAVAMWVSGASTEYKQVRPLMAIITAEPATMKLVRFDFISGYNPNMSIYETADVAIQNEGTASVPISVSVILYDLQNLVIASGQKTVDVVAANQTVYLKIVLTWEQGKTVLDYASAKVDVY